MLVSVSFAKPNGEKKPSNTRTPKENSTEQTQPYGTTKHAGKRN
jgi:hypothetical protein